MRARPGCAACPLSADCRALREGTVAQWGFDKQSTNALAWLVPVRSGLVGDGRWLANVMATDWQYEGYAYLGAGVLALLALWLPRGRELPAVIRRHAPLFMIALAFFVVALSNHIYVGGHEVATYKVPWFLKWIPGQFRAPGRFVWIPMYVGMLFVLHRGLGRFATGWRPLVLVGLAVLQLLDARGDWAEQRAWTSGPRANVIDRDRWRDLVHAHAAVQIHPTHACLAGDRVAWLADVAGTIELLASERALPINGTYSARTIRRCADEAHAWPRLAPEPDTLYVLLPPATSLAAQLAAAGAHCASFEDARVCTLRRDALDAAVTAGAVTPLRR